MGGNPGIQFSLSRIVYVLFPQYIQISTDARYVGRFRAFRPQSLPGARADHEYHVNVPTPHHPILPNQLEYLSEGSDALSLEHAKCCLSRLPPLHPGVPSSLYFNGGHVPTETLSEIILWCTTSMCTQAPMLLCYICACRRMIALRDMKTSCPCNVRAVFASRNVSI
jgi:hypothetical protein